MKATTEKAFGVKLQSVFSNPCEKWQMKKLGGIISLEYGKPLLDSQRDSSGLYPVYGANGIKDRTNEFYWNKPSIIVGRKGSAGEINITESKFWPLDVTYFIKFDEELYNLRFVYYLLKTLNLPQLAKGVKPGINRNEVYSVEVCVPESITEQHRIVSILDEAFTEIDKAKKNTEENIKKNKELFEAKFRSVFANLGSDWKEDCIGNLCDLMTGGTPSRTEKEYFDDGDIPWLVSGDVNTKEIFDCEGRITELGMKNSNAKYLPINSVLIALNGQGKTRGTVAKLRMKATCNQSIVSIYPKDLKKINADYIYHNLNARYQEIRKITSDSGNDRRGLNMPLIKNIKVSYPSSLQEQLLLVQKFDKMQNERSNLELIYNQKLTHLEELKKSILKQAFEGKL
jgi:type I restriction enzyme S subunit